MGYENLFYTQLSSSGLRKTLKDLEKILGKRNFWEAY